MKYDNEMDKSVVKLEKKMSKLPKKGSDELVGVTGLEPATSTTPR